MSCMVIGDEKRVVDMVKLGYRSAIIRATVPSVSWLRLRKICRSLGVETMDRGPLPTSRRILRTAKSCLGGSVLMSIYERLHPKASVTIKMSALETALRIYSALREDTPSLGDPIDNNAAWVLARDLRSAEVFWADCACGFRYLICTASLRPDACPACVIQREEGPPKKRKKKAPAPMFPSAHDGRFMAHVEF